MSFSIHRANHDAAIHARLVDGAGFGKVAIITGCGSGLGLASTQLFLSHQYEVLGVDVNEMDYRKIDEKDQERFHFHRGDLTKDGECDEVVRICVGKFGEKIDILANVAGIMDSFEGADSFTDVAFNRVIAVNLTIPIRMMRAVLPFMRVKKSGAIINVCSKAAISGAVAGLAYTASKHGLLGATKHTAWRFKDEGIRCNAVLPGMVATNISASIDQSRFDMAGFATLKPVMDLHTSTPSSGVPAISAAEVANVILFLASDGAKAINGIGLPIDTAWGVI